MCAWAAASSIYSQATLCLDAPRCDYSSKCVLNMSVAGDSLSFSLQDRYNNYRHRHKGDRTCHNIVRLEAPYNVLQLSIKHLDSLLYNVSGCLHRWTAILKMTASNSFVPIGLGTFALATSSFRIEAAEVRRTQPIYSKIPSELRAALKTPPFSSQCKAASHLSQPWHERVEYFEEFICH